MNLDERRALLRAAAKGTDPAGVAGVAAALDGADEEERAALAKTLPPTRWVKAEGRTPRAWFAVVALGKPVAAADAIGRGAGSAEERGVLTGVVLDAALGRSASWAAEFVEAVSEHWWWLESLWSSVTAALIDAHRLAPGDRYLQAWVGNWVRPVEYQGRPTDGRVLVDALLADPAGMERAFWPTFASEAMGANHNLTTSYTTPIVEAAVQLLVAESPGFRERLLDESLGGLLRDFGARNVVWPVRMHRLTDPSPAEVAARQASYLAVLNTAPSTAVTLAQDLLKLVPAAELDAAGLVDASLGVLTRREKKLVKAQLGLLRAVASEPAMGLTGEIGALLASVVDGLPADLAADAQALAASLPAGDALPDPGPAQPGEPVSVPGPRTAALPRRVEERGVPEGPELADLVATHLEGGGDGSDLSRIVVGLAAARPADPVFDPTLLDRAAATAKLAWDASAASPRFHLAALVCRLADHPHELLRFKGWQRYVRFGAGDAAADDREVRRSEWGYRYEVSNAPSALLVGILTGWGVPEGGLVEPLAPRARRWERRLVVPGEGTYGHDRVIGDAPRPIWLADDPLDRSLLADRALDVELVGPRYTFRAKEARELDGYDQVVEWASWLLRDNPDTLAAQFHPTLLTAVQVVNVRGVVPLLAALGAATEVPGGPTYSALALGLSAKMADQRAAAAEALAELAASGLLDPAAFASELGAHLREGFVLAGRAASALTDAASISAIAGYRVLQALGELLPAIGEVQQPAALVELSARLADEFGTPIPVPEWLADKVNGGSLLAVSTRALQAVVPRPTDAATAAADEALRAIEAA